MKKLFLLFVLVFGLAVQTLWAQSDTEPVNFTAILQDVFALNVTGGQDQTATFTTAAQYNNGVFEGAGIASGFTTVTMEATGNWNLYIASPDFNSGTETIPINNLGVWVQATGAHQIGTEVLCSNISAVTSLGLSNASQLLIDLNPADPNGNGGDATDNAFTMHWRMGTRDNASMNPLSMFDQMANGDFGPGTYTTIVSLTMNAIP